MDIQKLPLLDSHYPISSNLQRVYQDKGVIRLNGVASADEVQAYREVIKQAANRVNTEIRPLAERGDTYSKAFLQLMNLWPQDEAVKRFTVAIRYARIAADLMGVDGVRIYHDQALFKEPGGAHTPWHQDHYYWPIDTDKTVTMWMAMHDLADDMGTLTFAAGSHTKGYLGTLPISDESDEVFKTYVRDHGFELMETGAMKAGDATFHDGWALHAAPPNRSSVLREAMTVIYVADGCRVTEPINNNQRDDIERWLPGSKAGDLVATHLNPLVWSRQNP